MDYEISSLPIHRADDVMSYLRLQYGEKTYCADPTYFRWLHFESPCDWYRSYREKGCMPVNALLNREGNVVGVHTYVPFDTKTPWKGVRGAWDIDWVHSTSVRGAGRKLANRLLNDVDVYVGYGCNALSRDAFIKMGFRFVNNVPRVVGLIDIRAMNAVLEKAGLCSRIQGLKELKFSKKKWYLMSGINEIDETLFSSTITSDCVLPVRTKNWIQWRYIEHPYIKYTFLSTDKSCSSVAVIRLEPIKNNKNYLVCRILDIYSKIYDVTALLLSVLSFAKENGAVMVDYFTTNTRQADTLIQSVKGKCLNLMLNCSLPYKFQPIEYSIGQNSFNFVLSRGGKAPKSFAIEGFFSTKADANQDVYLT